MKVEPHRLPEVSPQALEALAAQSSDTARQALAAFVKRLIEEQYRPSNPSADPTAPPAAPRSEQMSNNTQNNEPQKDNKI